jgi:twitching motility two-component system response regulator PilH
MADMKKIVLADDEKYIAKAYAEGLSRAGFDVTTADNGTEALEKIKAIKPDIVLLDLIMPGMTGFEVLKKMTGDSDLKRIPVFILSNLSQETDKDEAMKLGAKEFLIKSDASLQDVVDKVTAFLKK